MTQPCSRNRRNWRRTNQGEDDSDGRAGAGDDEVGDGHFAALDSDARRVERSGERDHAGDGLQDAGQRLDGVEDAGQRHEQDERPPREDLGAVSVLERQPDHEQGDRPPEDQEHGSGGREHPTGRARVDRVQRRADAADQHHGDHGADEPDDTERQGVFDLADRGGQHVEDVARPHLLEEPERPGERELPHQVEEEDPREQDPHRLVAVAVGDTDRGEEHGVDDREGEEQEPHAGIPVLHQPLSPDDREDAPPGDAGSARGDGRHSCCSRSRPASRRKSASNDGSPASAATAAGGPSAMIAPSRRKTTRSVRVSTSRMS